MYKIALLVPILKWVGFDGPALTVQGRIMGSRSDSPGTARNIERHGKAADEFVQCIRAITVQRIYKLTLIKKTAQLNMSHTLLPGARFVAFR